MRVALIHDEALHDYSTGLAGALRPLVDLLVVTITTDLGPGEVERSEATVRLGRARARDPRSIKASLALRRELATWRSDAIHLQATANPWFDVAVATLARSTPLVVTAHDLQPHPGDSGVYPFAFRGLHHVCRQAHRLIIHAEALRPLARDASLSLDRLRVLPHGELGTIVAAGRHALPLPASTGSTILFFGRAHRYKGLDIAVDAVGMLRDRGLDVSLLVCGQGAQLDELLASGLPSFCRVVRGRVPAEQVLGYFEESTIVALPYREASQSGVAAIAAGVGRAAVVTSVGGLPEIVAHGTTGLVVPPEDPVRFADAVQRLLVDDEERLRLEQGAFTRATSGDLAWSDIAQRTVAVYSEALEESSSTRP